ncbi:TetR/AcrR family transcriptional regulator [Rudaeicoccus suwonensis]|uniref:TetR family transcriptional regulator n=1 Tax=Rudaeicoccus suwonensis TaxID=657409 RepID=A0A561EBK5_9MICO|nr:TetR/AcrR family transcriptional regulator [Rudaeicoccus suwonensis]TWE12988.1 TetR family transcriptional regulator [Rudaeicoccus suwonensis]
MTKRTPSARGEGGQLREDIVDTALQLVEELDDPWSLSLRAVARKLGIAATSIYLHFDSLESLLTAVKSKLWLQFGEQLAEAGHTTDDSPKDRLVELGLLYADFAEKRPGAFRTLFATSWNLDLPDGCDYIGQPEFELIVDTVRPVCTSDEDARERAIQLWCGIHGAVVLRSPLSKFPWPDLREQINALATRITS